MFSDYSIEEKLLVCALVNDLVSESKETMEMDYTLLGMVGKLTPALSQFIVLSETYRQATGLGKDMMNNAQISKFVWENMSIEKRRKLFYLFLEFIDLPEVRKNLAEMTGVACALRNTMKKVEPSLICNAFTGQFICDKYGIKTDPITY